ncbi:MAG TPA: ATP phosphoribosyltransferase [Deltaproteobacteria bacterium]|nr:ATP phosphoribosyltransferase [Deltaproteobacteria bacterium]
MTEERTLRIGLPKGSLQETTTKLFKKAGYDVRISGRSYYPSIDDPEIECILIRPQEMARYVGQGVLDCAITGHDWVLETGADVAEMADLRAPWPNYGPVRWILAVKDDSEFRTPKDLDGKRIATEVMGLTERYFARQGVEARLEFSWGATEVKPPVLADAIVDVTETGSSLRANQLRVIDEILESTPRLIAHHASLEDDWKAGKIERLRMLLMGAIAAATRVGLSMNVEKAKMKDVLALLPHADKPTISPLADPSWVDIFVIVEESFVRDLLPKLHAAGARGIVENPLNKIID